MAKAVIYPEEIRDAIKPFKEDVKICISNNGIFLKGESEIITEREIEEPPFFVREKEHKEIIRTIPAERITELSADKEFCCITNVALLRHIISPRRKQFKKAAIEISDKDNSIEFKQKVWRDDAPADIDVSYTQLCREE